MAAELSDESLRSALEFAVAIAAVGVKLRPPMPVPVGFKPYLRFQKLPSPALTSLRAAIEADAMFLHRLSVVATPELVDEVGMLWLTRPAGWQATAAAVALNSVPDADEAGELRREQKRRKAAEGVAARSRLDAAALSDQLEVERAARATIAAVARQLKSELAAARAHVRQLERSVEKLGKTASQAAAEPKASNKPRKPPPELVQRERKPIAVPGGLHGNSEIGRAHV